jgi:hypothetical protein
MPHDQGNYGQVIWGAVLVTMGLLLCISEPYALRESPDSAFLTFTRYFIALFLIVAGGKKLYKVYLLKDKEPPSQE